MKRVYEVNFKTAELIFDLYQSSMADPLNEVYNDLSKKMYKAMADMDRKCPGFYTPRNDTFVQFLRKLTGNKTLFIFTYDFYKSYQTACKILKKIFTNEELQTIYKLEEKYRMDSLQGKDENYSMVSFKYKKILEHQKRNIFRHRLLGF